MFELTNMKPTNLLGVNNTEDILCTNAKVKAKRSDSQLIKSQSKCLLTSCSECASLPGSFPSGSRQTESLVVRLAQLGNASVSHLFYRGQQLSIKNILDGHQPPSPQLTTLLITSLMQEAADKVNIMNDHDAGERSLRWSLV